MPVLSLDQGLVLAIAALSIPLLAVLVLIVADLRAARRPPPRRPAVARGSARPHRKMGEPRPFAAPVRAPRR